MATQIRPESNEAIGQRLRWIRIAYGIVQKRAKEPSQAEFARICEITPAAWNNAETGDNRIGLDSAMAVSRRTGVGLNYIYFGLEKDLPHEFAIEIAKIRKAEEKPEKSPSRRG